MEASPRLSDLTALPAVRRNKKHAPKRIDGRSWAARQVRSLTREYTKRLGDRANEPFVRETVAKCAELEVIASAQRANAINGRRFDMLAISRLEIAARRLRLRLGLDEPPPPPQRMTIDDYVRLKQQEQAAS
jgi:hypothetical protein